MLVEGPAGIGKTRLLAAGRDLASERGVRTLMARGSELERTGNLKAKLTIKATGPTGLKATVRRNLKLRPRHK